MKMLFSLGLVFLLCAQAPISTNADLPTKYNYRDAITKSLLFYYAQRSGRLPANDNPIPYRSDSALKDRGRNGEDLTGGYYDAGDHVKFGFPMAGTTTIIAWSIIDYQLGYSSVGQLRNALNMVKWATDYFIKAWNPATKTLYGQVSDGNIDHKFWGRPEDMNQNNRPAFSISPNAPGSDLAGETAAALAAASIVFSSVDRGYSSRCLTHAKQLYDFAKKHQGKYQVRFPKRGNSGQHYYDSSSFEDELAWSAIWLYRATKDPFYLNEAKAFYAKFGLAYRNWAFSWDDKSPGVQVMLAKLTGEEKYKNDVKGYCDAKVNQPKTPKGLVFINAWGSLRYAANSAFICLQAADLNINAQTYRKFAQKQIHYILGDTGRSFVVGFGVNPPVKPHHRSSSCPRRPAPCGNANLVSKAPNPQILYGAMVGGPSDNRDSYVDDRENYQTNEVALDYNAGFQASLAALQSLAVKNVFN
ncbi:endoglucanase E-4-like [Daphnia magna]|uniref:Endoglucanase n=1 Tax=Daphnia magna TaxID=35525 RepID=A0ABR0A6X0_9CRUS|nr:endoglucanase E-4-like [Daphnia magna]KAK4020891.1 hypothetical protein OUZ56_002833 [Daphnia magna]